MAAAPTITETIPRNANGTGAPLPVAKRRVKADPLTEYVAGGPLYYLSEYVRSLPHHIDDITRQFGDDLYERMLLDAKVASCIETLKLSCLSAGIRVVPAKKKGEKDYDRARRIADFCQSVLDNLETPLEEVMYDLLDCIPFGNRLAEQVYHIPTRGPLSGKLVLKAIKPKPRRSTAYVTDSKNNIVGILGIVPGQYAPLTVDSLLAAPGDLPNLLPRKKFVVFTFRSQNADPRGRSALRACYNAWWLKTQLWPELMRHLAQFGSPKVIVILPDGATEVERIDAATGEPELDDDGFPKTISPAQAALDTATKLRNGMAAVFPNGTTIQPLEVADSGGQTFESAISLFDDQITQSILGQTLATDEGKHQARAASQTHQDILGLYTQFCKRTPELSLRRDLLRPLVEYNFGPGAVSLTPYLSLSETEQQDFATGLTALAAAGYLISPSQLPDIDAKIGLPVRSDDEVQQAQDAAETAANPQDATDAGGDGGAGAGNAGTSETDAGGQG